MKTKKTNEAAATPSPKGKAKLQNLKLHKETLQNLSDQDLSNQDANAVRGGAAQYTQPGGAARQCP